MQIKGEEMKRKTETTLKDFLPWLNLLPDFIFKWLVRKELAKFADGEWWGRPTIYSTDDYRLIIIKSADRDKIMFFGKAVPWQIISSFFRNQFQADVHNLSDGGIKIYFVKETRNPRQRKLPIRWQ